MMYDTDTIRTAISVAGFAFAVGTAVYAWWVARGKKTQQQIDVLARRMNEAERRLTLIERDNYYAPSHGDITKLTDSISKLHGDLREMSGRLTGINRAVDNMHNHLMDTSRRSSE